jgi:hypothetical protein
MAWFGTLIAQDWATFLNSQTKTAANLQLECFWPLPGPDVMILKIFSPKNFAKKLAFLTQNKANFWKNWYWYLRKTPFCCRKLGKIAENCDHNIDPWLKAISLKIMFAQYFKVFLMDYLAISGCAPPLPIVAMEFFSWLFANNKAKG